MDNYADKLAVAEQAITDFITGKSTVQKLENVLGHVLSSCAFCGRSNTYNVTLIKTDNLKQPFFGARIYPAIDLLEKLVSETVVELHPFKEISASWRHIDHWVIELDSGLFNRNVISLLPKEIMAAILHEIGHTIYSDKVLERFYRSYKTMYVHMKTAEKDAIKLGYTLFTVPLAVSCGLRSWVRGRRAIREEFFADRIVNEYGYGDFYVSLLSKIVEAYGNSMIEDNDVECDNAVSERTRWASINIVDTVRRKNRLKDDMYLASARTPSMYLKALYAKTLNELGVNLRERYTGDAVECTIELLSDPQLDKAYEMITDTDRFNWFSDAVEATLHRDKYTKGTPAFESILRNKLKKGLPSWHSIDSIQIEIDRMTNHHDRAFVLDMIYSKIDDINEFLDYIRGDENLMRKYGNEAQKMLDELDAQREAVLRRKNFANRYSIFVKYPEGYEG